MIPAIHSAICPLMTAASRCFAKKRAEDCYAKRQTDTRVRDAKPRGCAQSAGLPHLLSPRNVGRCGMDKDDIAILIGLIGIVIMVILATKG